MLESLAKPESWYHQDFSSVHQLMQAIREDLKGQGKLPTDLPLPDCLVQEFDPAISQIYITLFQIGTKKIRWGSRRKTLRLTLARVLERLRAHKRFAEFDLADSKKCRILLEMVIGEDTCNIRNLTIYHFSRDRFEAGITGLKYRYQKTTRFFMPTDAVTQSILTVNQLLNFLSKQTGHAKLTNSIKERAHLMRREPIEYTKLISIAFINGQDKTLPLHRGYPVPMNFNRQILYQSTIKSIDWLVENMNTDGSFLYFYDGIKDTKVDLDHPNMKDPLYNNILRHCGGTITLLRGYELTGEIKYLSAAKISIEFFLSTLHEHQYQGEYACYPFFNNKSKLGGAGIGLVAMMHYYRHSDDHTYDQQITGLVRHLLSRVAKDGEMIGYYLHPKFNQGKPLTLEYIETLCEADKKALFSFYYPGEALLGLALYYRYFENIDATMKADIQQKSLKALDFLIYERPRRYAELFLSLPADAWLMQAIEEWVKERVFQKQAYIDFVYHDADQMIAHSYTEKDGHWFDYIGGFYYQYGDSVYHDGSRCEGLIAAYYLAQYLGDKSRADFYMKNLLKSAKGLMFTRHTEDSLYAHRYPCKSLNSFRFKLTRQWVRVDSVQHTACFFARLYMLPYLF